MEQQVNSKRKIFASLGPRLLGAVSIALVLHQFPFHYIQSLFYDARVRLTPAGPVSSYIATVSVDRPTILSLGREADASEYAIVLKKILRDNPVGILFAMDPLKIKGSPQQIRQLIQTANGGKNVYVAINNTVLPGHEAEIQLPKPWQDMPVAMGPLTVDKTNFAADGVTRRILIAYEGRLAIQAVLAQYFNKIVAPKDYRGNFGFLTSEQTLIDFRPAGTFRPASFLDVLENRIAPGVFSGKIVVVGHGTGIESEDTLRTPYSRAIDAMTRTEVHANVLNTLILNSGIVSTPPWLSLLLSLLVAVITATVVWAARPTRGILILIASLMSLLVVGWVVFAGFGINIGLAHPVLALLICYYFFIPYRLILENKKSWEYQEKNKLLLQVEELKTNFMSMMSHDLKTPLARIQGMADMALHDQQPLSVRQREALETITRSTEELSIFINSVLSLTRIEGRDVKLHLQSRDVNALVEEIIKKYEFAAKEKNIQIITELEPLFSIKIDVDLMRQVVTNLVENAIKYSPEGTKVLVTTEEIGGRIVIQVADQGLGIPTDEQGRIFMKFYRSSGAKNSPIRGSGLGLYLAKYFVDLHHGEISVESEPGQGSTFTVQLPMDQ